MQVVQLSGLLLELQLLFLPLFEAFVLEIADVLVDSAAAVLVVVVVVVAAEVVLVIDSVAEITIESLGNM